MSIRHIVYLSLNTLVVCLYSVCFSSSLSRVVVPVLNVNPFSCILSLTHFVLCLFALGQFNESISQEKVHNI